MCGRDVMKQSSPTVACADESSLTTRRQSIPADRAVASSDRGDVDRWVAMINAELDADDGEGSRDASCDFKTASACAEHKNSISATKTQTCVEVTIEFGRTHIDESSQKIGAGSLISLDQLADEPVDIVVSGRTVARGELVTVKGKIAVRIVEVMMLLIAFLSGFETTHAEERVRETPQRRVVQIAAEELDEAVLPPKGSSRKQGESSRITKPTKNELFESSAVSSFSERVENGSKSASITLTPPSMSRLSHSAKEGANNAERTSQTATTGWGSTVWPLLAIVRAIVLGTRWLKKYSPTATRGLPSEAFDVLGRRMVDQRTSVVMARCGSRILVLSLSPHGLQTLAEITDPVEVDCLAGLCHTTQRDQSLADTFRAMLHKPTVAKSVTSTPAVAAQSNQFNESRWPDRLLNDAVVSPLRETH